MTDMNKGILNKNSFTTLAFYASYSGAFSVAELVNMGCELHLNSISASISHLVDGLNGKPFLRQIVCEEGKTRYKYTITNAGKQFYEYVSTL